MTKKLALKTFNYSTATWETQSIDSPDLAIHAGAKASVYQAGHVQLTSALDSESEVLAPTAKALKTVLDAVTQHVNDEEAHTGLTEEQLSDIANIGKLLTDFANHKNDTMPHKFTLDGVDYKYGLRPNEAKDGLVFVYETL